MFSFVPAFMKVALMYGSKQLYLCLYLCYILFLLRIFFLIFKSLLLEILKFNKKEDKMEGMFDKCLFVLRNLSSLLERLCALQSRVFDRFFEAAEIAKFTSREFGEHWENLKSFRDWYSVMSTQLKKGREEDLKEGLETGL